MGKHSSAPAAPDPQASAAAQTGLNQQTAAYNAALDHPNVYTPLGSQVWSQNGTDPRTGAPLWSQQINLTPEAQQAFNNTQQTQAGLSGLQQQALGGVQSTLSSNPFDRSALPAAPINAGMTAQQAIMSRLQPQIDMQNKQFEQDQANKGIAPGSEAYMNARRSISQQQNDQYQQAALAGINEDQQARQNAMGEQQFYANAPLNYLNGLMSGSQVQMPNFPGGGMGNATQPANIMQALQNQYQGQLAGYNANVATDNANTQAGSGALTALLMAMAMA